MIVHEPTLLCRALSILSQTDVSGEVNRVYMFVFIILCITADKPKRVAGAIHRQKVVQAPSQHNCNQLTSNLGITEAHRNLFIKHRLRLLPKCISSVECETVYSQLSDTNWRCFLVCTPHPSPSCSLKFTKYILVDAGNSPIAKTHLG